jgi:hypothetical protein
MKTALKVLLYSTAGLLLITAIGLFGGCTDALRLFPAKSSSSTA